jgi:hypothetical protein
MLIRLLFRIFIAAKTPWKRLVKLTSVRPSKGQANLVLTLRQASQGQLADK